jgi:hypothetical protein
MELYSAIKKKEKMSFSAKQVELVEQVELVR